MSVVEVWSTGSTSERRDRCKLKSTVIYLPTSYDLVPFLPPLPSHLKSIDRTDMGHVPSTRFHMPGRSMTTAT
jgi:hypothetical protein